MIMIVASTSPASFRSGAALQSVPALRSAPAVDGADQQGLRRLAPQDADRRNIAHRDFITVFVPDEVVGHDLRWCRLPQLLPGRKTQMRKRGPVGVEETMLAITDRHGIAQFSNDRLESALRALKRSL
jgi:hypothetical protein